MRINLIGQNAQREFNFETNVIRVATEEELKTIVGQLFYDGEMEVLAVPKWNEEHQRWEALARVRDSLCIVEIKIHTSNE